ncbi:YisL family protein [Bacillus testis]|uniref:YisL family protein n=1 Tax=Bacillus testis TaxID=1622072 RepID=UPI00067EDF6E|nr:YisL family protein [Bacillus testis]
MFHLFNSFHASSWAILLVAFFLTYFLENKKIMSIILRLFYVVMLVSGIGMLTIMEFPMHFVVKGILAILLIGLMEMLLARQKKQSSSPLVLWILFIIDLILIILLGYKVISL